MGEESDSSDDVNFGISIGVPVEKQAPPPPPKTNWVMWGAIIALVVVGATIGVIYAVKQHRQATAWEQLAQEYIAAVQTNTPYQLPSNPTSLHSTEQMHFAKSFYAAADMLKQSYSLANAARLLVLAEHMTSLPPFYINCDFKDYHFTRPIEYRVPEDINLKVLTLEGPLRTCLNSLRETKEPIAKEKFASCLKTSDRNPEEKTVAGIISVIDFKPKPTEEQCTSNNAK